MFLRSFLNRQEDHLRKSLAVKELKQEAEPHIETASRLVCKWYFRSEAKNANGTLEATDVKGKEETIEDGWTAIIH